MLRNLRSERRGSAGRRLQLSVVLASLLVAPLVSGNWAMAKGSSGGLAFGGCIGDLSGCVATTPAAALDSAEGVAVSGSNVYVAAAGGNALSHFTLDAAGNPSFVGCTGDLSGCTATSPTTALDGASSVAVSGQNLYVTAGQALSHFTLDAAGNPTFVGCTGNLAGCTVISPSTAFTGSLDSVIVNGSSLYASALESVSYFTLDASGTPTFVGCFGAATGCTAISPSNALDGAGRMAVGGSNLYVAVSFQSNVSHFTLAADGTPTFDGCIGLDSGCTATNPAGALSVAGGVAVGGSGSSLYASGGENSFPSPGAVSWLTLDASGNPTFDLCVGNKTGCSSPKVPTALDNPGAVFVNGQNLFVSALDDLSLLALNASGSPTFTSCIGNLKGCTATTPAGALADTTGMAMGGQDLYVTSVSGNSLSYLVVPQPKPHK